MFSEGSHDDRSRTATSRLGSVLNGKWELREVLGSGAMASVYLGVHRNGSRVAIKVLHPELMVQRELVRRLLREGHLANRVEHPSIVRVLDDDIGNDGAPFLVMELVEGESLSDVLAREGPLDPIRAVQIGIKVLDALAAAHANGIVHRDVKPANIALQRDGGIKILDFGIARLREGAPADNATREGWVMGTPAFMAPEQAIGHHDQIDGSTDVWAVGATLFALLTGKTVRDEATNASEALVWAMWKPAPLLATRRPNVPAGIGAVIDRAMLFDKRARWPSALAMKAALERALTDTASVPFTCIIQTDCPVEPDGLGPAPARASASAEPRSPLPLFTGLRLGGSEPAAHRLAPAAARGSMPPVAERAHPGQHARALRYAGIAIVVAILGLTCALVALASDDVIEARPKHSANADKPSAVVEPSASFASRSTPVPAPSNTFEDAKVAPAPAPSSVTVPKIAGERHARKSAALGSSAASTSAPSDLLDRGRF